MEPGVSMGSQSVRHHLVAEKNNISKWETNRLYMPANPLLIWTLKYSRLRTNPFYTSLANIPSYSLNAIVFKRDQK